MPKLEKPESLEIIKAPVVIGENVVQRMKVTTLTLDKPAIKIKKIDTSIRNIQTEVIENKVIIQGIIHKEVFYVANDHIIHHQTEDTRLSTFIDIPGAEAGMDVVLEPTIEHATGKLLTNGNLLHQKVVLQLFVKVLSRQQLFVKTGSGPLVKTERVIGENSVQTIVTNDLTLAVKAGKITDITAEVKELETEAIDDMVIVQGVVHKELYYIGEDEIEHQQSEDIPFSEFIDIPGTEPGMNVQAYWNVENIKGKLSSDRATVNQKITLEFIIKITEPVQINLVTGKDALVMLPEVIGENTKQFLSETRISLEQMAREIIEIEASFENINAEVLNDKVIVQGIIHKEIYYMGKDCIEYHQTENIPFCTLVNVVGARPDMIVDVIPSVVLTKPSLYPDGETLTQKFIGDIFVKVTENIQFNVCELESFKLK